MEEVCYNVRNKPMLCELSGERFKQPAANRRPGARLDLSTDSVLESGYFKTF